MTRVGHALLTLVGGACLAFGCSGSTPRDQNFNTDAESGFVPPPPSFDASAETSGTAGVGGESGAGGAAGDTGAGGSGGAAGTGTTVDAATDGGAG